MSIQPTKHFMILKLDIKNSGSKMSIGINIYHMQYKNQLVLTGEINDVGAYRRANIDESYRKGIEVEGFYKITKKMIWSGNLTLSENKIIRHTEFIDNWDTWDK